ncbi:MAG: SUF system NifU family Fe-S cluster assembly protein [Pseudomonadota bacterium]|nr:SUF system NifU family Fe-S cluster assembly protein [Pseudomonadota bacterium]
MHDNLDMLYQQMILDHSKHPRHFKQQENTQGWKHETCYNPLCGDQIEVFVNLDGDNIESLLFSGHGCAICIASASLMSSVLQSTTITHVKSVFDWFQHELTGQPIPEGSVKLDKLSILLGVKQFPMRVKCATCGWHALLGALNAQKNQT